MFGTMASFMFAQKNQMYPLWIIKPTDLTTNPIYMMAYLITSLLSTFIWHKETEIPNCGQVIVVIAQKCRIVCFDHSTLVLVFIISFTDAISILFDCHGIFVSQVITNMFIWRSRYPCLFYSRFSSHIFVKRYLYIY